MWLICQTTFRRGKTKLLIRGIHGSEWVFCPMVKRIKSDKVSIHGCKRCSRFISLEQTCTSQARTRKGRLLPKHTSALHFMKPTSRWKVKYPSVNSLSQPLSLIREKQPLFDVFDEKNHLVILAQLPGIDEKDVKIKAEENTVTITAQNATKKFLETIKLPTCIEKDAVLFTYRNNILQAMLKKTASYNVVKNVQVNG